MKRNSKHNKKIRSLVIICVLSALLLTVGTYAWFIGMQTVSVNSFEVKIAAVDGLTLSLDGKSWGETLDVSTAAQYEGNTNEFLTDDKEGLKPISTIGEFDTESSRLKLFEKGSLTATEGGYRLMTSRVNNYDETEAEGRPYLNGDGYVVFDLFVKNLSGDAYYVTDDKDNEEAIYLTYDSKVTAGSTGIKSSGIENSVRVGFAQIARVNAADYGTTDATENDIKVVTGMNCTSTTGSDGKSVVTNICRDTQIWEPNHNTHTDDAKTWYQKTCIARRAASDGESAGFYYSYNEGVPVSCASLDSYIATNAVGDEILANDYVDVYDVAYNGYTVQSSKLSQFNTFTDDEKNLTGTDREEFMTLAPNSITKIRVYIWIEGQDVDNYDFASLGHSISVNFGFTKERITTGEVNPSINPDLGPNGTINEEQLPTADIAYEATGTVENISSSNVTYKSEEGKFVYDRKQYITKFTFEDDGVVKTTEYNKTDGWKIS